MNRKLILLSALVLCAPILAITPLLGSEQSSTATLQEDFPFEAASAYAQAGRILIEGADSILSHNLQKSEQLGSQATSVSPRILVEYADSVLTIDLEPPILVTNEFPLANAGVDQTVAAGITVTLDGSASRDPDGSVVSYEWDFGDGTKATGKIVTHTYSELGVYTVVLTVTDNSGAKATDTVTIQVMRENHPPVISSLYAEQDQVLLGARVTITSVVNDSDGDTVTYSWSSDGGSFIGTGSTVTWNAPNKEGIYSISLEVNDGRGGVQSDSISIRVSSETIVSPSQPQHPYVDLYGHVTDVTVGEEIILELSVVNPITSPGTLVVQLTLRIPSGWSITSSGFAHGAGGLRTNTYEIEQGPNPQVIDVHILANEAYEGDVFGYMDYYFKGKEPKYHNEARLPVSAKPTQPIREPPDETPPVPSSPTPWWSEPQWLVPVILASIAVVIAIIKLIIRLRRGP